MIRAADLSSQLDDRRRRMASAAYLSASLLGDLSDVPHMLDAPAQAADVPLAAAVAASYHLLSATGSGICSKLDPPGTAIGPGTVS